MDFIQSLVWVLVLFLAVILVTLVLLQPSKDAGNSSYGFASFSGSNGVLGVSSAKSFLSRLTTWVAFALFVSCLLFSYLGINKNKSLLENNAIKNENISTDNIDKSSDQKQNIIPD